MRNVGTLPAVIIALAIVGVTRAEGAGPLAARCQVTLNVEGSAPRTWNIYFGNFVRDPTTGEHNASLRFHEPATGELGVGTAQFEPLTLDPATGSLRPVPVRVVAKSTPPSGDVRERMYRTQVQIIPQTGTLSPVGVSELGEQMSIVTAGNTFSYQARTFTMAGTCVPAEDP